MPKAESMAMPSRPPYQKVTSEIIQILLKDGADINAQGGVYGNALQAALSKRSPRYRPDPP